MRIYIRHLKSTSHQVPQPKRKTKMSMPVKCLQCLGLTQVSWQTVSQSWSGCSKATITYFYPLVWDHKRRNVHRTYGSFLPHFSSLSSLHLSLLSFILETSKRALSPAHLSHISCVLVGVNWQVVCSAVRIFEISNQIEQLLQYSIRFETSTIIRNF